MENQCGFYLYEPGTNNDFIDPEFGVLKRVIYLITREEHGNEGLIKGDKYWPLFELRVFEKGSFFHQPTQFIDFEMKEATGYLIKPINVQGLKELKMPEHENLLSFFEKEFNSMCDELGLD